MNPSPSAPSAEDTTAPSDTLAAVDLGSNSFHMIIARAVGDDLQLIDRIKDMVRLGGGLQADGTISDEAQARALVTLARFGERLRGMPSEAVRAVGTNTLRQARGQSDFLERAQEALGHPIDIISGREEGRLVYLGVSHRVGGGADARRLVMDIGGGSTEIIQGYGAEVQQCESLYMGCVSFSERFFDAGIDAASMRAAILAARQRIHAVRHVFDGAHGWGQAIGSSGTFKAVQDVHAAMGLGEHTITRSGVAQIVEEVVRVGDVGALHKLGVSERREPVFAGGLAIIAALAESFALDEIVASDFALREGLIYDLVGRRAHHDVRDATVQRMMRTYHVDVAHAQRVCDTALSLFAQVEAQWGLDHPEIAQHLERAALLHEIGLHIDHDRYHKHGSYLVENSDMPGFARSDHKLLWALLRTHRKSFKPHRFEGLPPALYEQGLKVCVLLRLAVLLNRSRTDARLPARLEVLGRELMLRFEPGALEQAPLTVADLELEAELLRDGGWRLRFGAPDALEVSG